MKTFGPKKNGEEQRTLEIYHFFSLLQEVKVLSPTGSDFASVISQFRL